MMKSDYLKCLENDFRKTEADDKMLNLVNALQKNIWRLRVKSLAHFQDFAEKFLTFQQNDLNHAVDPCRENYTLLAGTEVKEFGTSTQTSFEHVNLELLKQPFAAAAQTAGQVYSRRKPIQ